MTDHERMLRIVQLALDAQSDFDAVIAECERLYDEMTEGKDKAFAKDMFEMLARKKSFYEAGEL